MITYFSITCFEIFVYRSLQLIVNIMFFNPLVCKWYPNINYYYYYLLTSDGVVTDPNKARAISDMPTQTDVKSLKKFLGVVSYIAKFSPEVSLVCEPLRRLELEDAEWCGCLFMMKLCRVSRTLFVRPQCWCSMMLVEKSELSVMHHSVDLVPPCSRKVTQ